jgi:hypothetical protein
MIEVPIDGDMLLAGRDRAAEMGVLKGSFTRGEGNLTGAYGEEIVYALLGRNRLKEVMNYDYDFEMIKTGETFDVKSKRTGVVPLPNYECSVSGWNTRQRTDYYIFTRVKSDWTMGWVLGYYPKKEFFEECTEYKKGDKDPSNNFTFKADAYSLPISQLKDIKDFM